MSAARELKLKTNSAQRLLKDRDQYKKDAEEESRRLDEERARAHDDESKARLRQTERAHKETMTAYEDVHSKLTNAITDLQILVQQHAGDRSLQTEIAAAQEVVAQLQLGA